MRKENKSRRPSAANDAPAPFPFDMKRASYSPLSMLGEHCCSSSSVQTSVFPSSNLRLASDRTDKQQTQMQDFAAKLAENPVSSNLVYDTALFLWKIVIYIFFREIRPRGAFNIPRKGPVIFVAAPHHNQARIYSSRGVISAHIASWNAVP